MQDVQVTARRTCPLGIRWIRGHVRVLTLRNIACCLGRHPPPRQQHQRYLPAAGRPCGQPAVSQARQTAERAARLRRPRPLRCTGGSRRRAGQRGCSSGTTTTSDSDLSIKTVILLSKLRKPALPNGTTNNLYNKLLVRPDEYQELPHHLITRIIKAHESTASGLASQTMG
jgi:hypothetical protein